jgi:hypothetical protein
MASVKDLPLVGRNHKKILKKEGISSTKTLLKKASCRSLRKKLAEKINVGERLVFAWAKQAALLEVKGIGPKYLKLLAKLKIKSPKELSAQDPELLFEKIFSLDSYVIKRLKVRPSKKAVFEWVKSAAGLRFRVEPQEPGIEFFCLQSFGKTLQFQKTVLDLAFEREWKKISGFCTTVKAKTVFDSMELNREMEKTRLLQKKEGLGKEILLSQKSELKATVFLFVLSNYCELVAQDNIFKKEMFSLTKTLPLGLTQQKQKLFLQKISEAELKQAKNHLDILRKKTSVLKEDKCSVLKSADFLKEITELFSRARIFSKKGKKR